MNGVLETLPERLGRLEQEQARMNGVLETIRAGLSYRVERADAGEPRGGRCRIVRAQRAERRENFNAADLRTEPSPICCWLPCNSRKRLASLRAFPK